MREKIKRRMPHALIRLYQAMRYFWISALFYLIRFLPIKRNLVVLCNVWGYGDNAKYVAEELRQRKRAAKMQEEPSFFRKDKAFWPKENSAAMELVFVTNHPEQVPSAGEIRAARTNSMAAILALGRARVWVDDNRKEAYIKKRKGQYYIQLWHGGIALKRIEGDCADKLGKKYIRQARRDSENTDLVVSNSTFCTKRYRRAFWAKCEIAEYGSPRNDSLMRERGRAFERTEKEEHTVIYAPTYRSGSAHYYDFDTERLRKAFADRFGGKWRILVRLHPLVAAQRQFENLKGVTDVSSAPDLYEMLFSADALITDYSNTMFEFAITGRPVFLYARDVREYQAERGLYFDYETLPFPKAKTPDSLYEEIRHYQAKDHQKGKEEFYRSLQLKESGEAAKLVADRIEKVLGVNASMPVS